jgi:hypothetical protein
MSLCKSIKSKKHPELRCPNRAVKGEWCAVHVKSQKEWKLVSESETKITKSRTIPFTQKEQNAASLIQRCWKRKVCRIQGSATFYTELADNDKDIYSYDSVKTIPLVYRFSYTDNKKHIWLFDLRFLIQSMAYDSQFTNPFTQEEIPHSVKVRIQKRSEYLSQRKIPVLYVNSDVLTPEQIWNQKVLDVFLKLTSLGYGVNIAWFEMMTVRAHELFYKHLYNLWFHTLGLTEEDRERVVPGYNSGRFSLFRWTPEDILDYDFDIRWWRKMNLGIMKTFITRSEDKDTQSCGALYILTALANMHPRVREAFPWLV